MSVCPHHCSTLGLGWSRGASTRCTVPESISKHGEWPKGERGLGKLESKVVFRQTGLLVPVGSCKSPTLGPFIRAKISRGLRRQASDSTVTQRHFVFVLGCDKAFILRFHA